MRSRGRPRLYDWDKWFSQPAFLLLVGRDYVCSQASMALQVRTEARRRKLFVKIVDSGVGLRVEVFTSRRNHKPRKGVEA